MRKLLTGIAIILLMHLCFSFVVMAGENDMMVLATTTSVQDSGLLDAVVAAYEKKTGKAIKTVAVGTGQALQMGRTGEADILWVHSPVDEERFVSEGYGVDRVTFMHNDFVIIGPKDDPVKAGGAKDAVEAFRKIAGSKAIFVSRADNSGTYKKEKSIWEKAAVIPDKKVYIEAGQGMAACIGIAGQKRGYCLTDRSTFISLAKSVDLVIVFEGGEDLINRYSLILVNPSRFPKVNDRQAKAFFDFMLSGEARDIINNFGKGTFGKQIFFYDYEVK